MKESSRLKGFVLTPRRPLYFLSTALSEPLSDREDYTTLGHSTLQSPVMGQLRPTVVEGLTRNYVQFGFKYSSGDRCPDWYGQ